MEWRAEAISRRHDRGAFDCGEPDLNEYLQRFARQHHESGGAKTFVAVPPAEPTHVLGYYSLAPASLDFQQVPPEFAPRLGRYPLPVYRLARLAVELELQGQGLGYELLLDAGARALAAATHAGGVALLIDAKSDRAAEWYRRRGATPLPGDPLTLLLPLLTILGALSAHQPPR